MKAHSLRYKMVYLMKEYDQKWKSYSKFNSSGYSENGKKIWMFGWPYPGSHTMNEAQIVAGFM